MQLQRGAFYFVFEVTFFSFCGFKFVCIEILHVTMCTMLRFVFHLCLLLSPSGNLEVIHAF